MMGKKTSWSIGKERKKGKKSAKPTVASVKGNDSAKGFSTTKEKLAKALGEMSAAEAIEYLSGPEPRAAGISDTVAASLCAEIIKAVAVAKADAAKEATAAAKEAAAATKAAAKQAAVATKAVAAEPASSLPEEDVSEEEAMARWRAYTAEAMAAAQKLEQQQQEPSARQEEEEEVPLFKPKPDDVPLFKPRAAAKVEETAPPPAAPVGEDVGEDNETLPAAAPPPIGGGFEWGETY